jgi:ADP-heptose:LPS heptosyltransferase
MKKRKKLETKQLVAVQFQNGIGNFIMMTPAITALANYNNAKVDIVLDQSWKDSRRQSIEQFCNGWDLVNSVIEFQNGFDKDKYKVLFYAYHGESSETHTFFKNNAKVESDHVNWRSEKINEVDYYMNMIYKMGYRESVPPLKFIPGSTANFRGDRLNDNNYFKIGFCNGFFAGSKWQWERKGWPHFERLAYLLKKYYPKGQMKIFLFGKGETEKKWAGKFTDNKLMFSLVNRTNILEATSCIRYMDLFITTDTGLMHIADAVGVPMIALFGPTLISKNGPYGMNNKIVRSPFPCSPCQQSPLFTICKETDRCMEALDPGLVMAAIRSYVPQLIKMGKMYRNEKTREVKSCLGL